MKLYSAILCALLSLVVIPAHANLMHTANGQAYEDRLRTHFIQGWEEGYCLLNTCSDDLAKKHFNMISLKIHLDLEKSEGMAIADRQTFLKQRLKVFRLTTQRLDGRVIPSVEHLGISLPNEVVVAPPTEKGNSIISMKTIFLILSFVAAICLLRWFTAIHRTSKTSIAPSEYSRVVVEKTSFKKENTVAKGRDSGAGNFKDAFLRLRNSGGE